MAGERNAEAIRLGAVKENWTLWRRRELSGRGCWESEGGRMAGMELGKWEVVREWRE